MPPKHTFPLPRASQANYTKYYKQTVQSGQLIRYKFLWVGTPLECRFKSDALKDTIGPHNVFILKKGASFAYAVVDKTDEVYKLPKKYFSTCFPGVQYGSIPPKNLITVKITRKESIEVPYIPMSFLQQKRVKTTRPKRKRTPSLDDHHSHTEGIDFNEIHATWHVLQNKQVRDVPIKRSILLLIRKLLQYSDGNTSYVPTDPFAGLQNMADIQNDECKTKTLKVILGFVYHYCRAELGCNPPDRLDATTLQSWIECLSGGVTE